MKKSCVIYTSLFVLIFAGCAKANISRSREAFILSQPHGWIELTISDANVPAQLPPENIKPEELAKWKPKPPLCYLTIRINNERFLYETIFPFGQEEPYEVDTGFRMPAPVGEFDLIIEYSNCDIDDDKMTDVSIRSNITIIEGKVTSIAFDGEKLTFEGTKENDKVTLEDIYNKLDELK